MPPELAAKLDELPDEVPGRSADPLPQLDQQRGPRGLQRRGALRLLHAPPRRGRPREDREAGVGEPVELPRVRGARLLPHRPLRPRRWACSVHPNFDDEQRQRRRGHEEHLRPELAGLLRQRPGRREPGDEPRPGRHARRAAHLGDRADTASTRRSTSATRREAEAGKNGADARAGHATSRARWRRSRRTSRASTAREQTRRSRWTSSSRSTRRASCVVKQARPVVD